MGDRKKKESRREPPTPSGNLKLLRMSSDAVVSEKQLEFCKALVEEVQEDKRSLSFSKPVQDLWDMSVLADYFEKIETPMDLGTVREELGSGKFVNQTTALFDPNQFRYDILLVFLNALQYNARGTDLARLASKFLHFIDREMVGMPGQQEEINEKSGSSAPEGIERKENYQFIIDKMHTRDKDWDKGVAEEKEPMKNADCQHLKGAIPSFQRQKAEAEAILAEFELVKSVPMSYEENAKLRDEVEALLWESAKKVVNILGKYADQGLKDSKEEDPKFVTVEFSNIEPGLLKDIEELIIPDQRVYMERKRKHELNEKIEQTEKKLRKIHTVEMGVKKRPRKRG